MPSSPSSCSPPFPLLSFPFTSPFLALPLPLSFLWIASLLILIAYALPWLSYLPPSSLVPSIYIWRRSVRAGHVRHLSGGKRSCKWQKGGVQEELLHEDGIDAYRLHIKYRERMLGNCLIRATLT